MSHTRNLPHPELQDLELDGEHLPLSVLDAYHRGVLDARDKPRVQRHLVVCRDCSETLLDLAQFLKDYEKPGRLWSAELAAAWEEWRASFEAAETREGEMVESNHG